MLQRTLELDEFVFFFLEPVIRFCSVHKPCGVAAAGTRRPPLSHLKKLGVFCETVFLTVLRIQIHHVAELCEHFEMHSTFSLGHPYSTCFSCLGKQSFVEILSKSVSLHEKMRGKSKVNCTCGIAGGFSSYYLRK